MKRKTHKKTNGNEFSPLSTVESRLFWVSAFGRKHQIQEIPEETNPETTIGWFCMILRSGDKGTHCVSAVCDYTNEKDRNSQLFNVMAIATDAIKKLFPTNE